MASATETLNERMRQLGHEPRVVEENAATHRIRARCAHCGAESDTWYDVAGDVLPRSMEGAGTTRPCTHAGGAAAP